MSKIDEVICLFLQLRRCEVFARTVITIAYADFPLRLIVSLSALPHPCWRQSLGEGNDPHDS